MSIVKSFSVGNGDMFYIEHNSDNFTIIDCCLGDENHEEILNELAAIQSSKGITRFMSTHPDEDHIQGLELLDEKLKLINFYVVKNAATKDEETTSFIKYKGLRDSDKAFYIYKGCTRRWMNQDNEERGSSGISILWPDTNNELFQKELAHVANGHGANNISAVIKYSVKGGVTVLWMGDLETITLGLIEPELDLPKVDILFAPHHGRESGKIPPLMLAKMNPKIVVIGEAPSEHLNYYAGYNTITQNSAGDIVFDCQSDRVHIFTSSNCTVDFLTDDAQTKDGYYYLGTLIL